MWFWLAFGADFHGVRLVDRQGSPFACATLTSVNQVVWTTDATGIAALYEPGLMGRSLWLTPEGAALEAPTDWLGIAGFAVTLSEGEQTTVEVVRTAPEGACALADREARLVAHGVPTAAERHEVQVLDAASGRPVPIARVRALGRDDWTDNGGRVAWFDLDAMDDVVTFEVSSDGFAPTVRDVVPTPGDRSEIPLVREMRAERLVRLTGAGTWRETSLLDLPTPLAEPLLDTDVVGQDTAYVVPWQGGLFSLWGDTQKPSYPLGNFSATGATTALDPTPEDGWDLAYFAAGDGFVAPITEPVSGAATWLAGLVEIEGDLYATALVIDSAWTVLGEGSLRWNTETSAFENVLAWPANQQPHPAGPAIRVEGADGTWVMYHDLVRTPATADALRDPATWEAWTPFVPDGDGFTVAREADGTPEYAWRAGTPAPSWDPASPWFLTGPDSPWWSVDPITGEEAASHGGTIAWSAWLGRWVHVFSQQPGTSFLGEAWVALGDTPVGPWTYAQEIVSHDDYTFYNPYLHPWYFQRDRILFEGTFTGWLVAREPTPRHDYNQVLYALDLDDPANVVPVPFYDVDSSPRAGRDVDIDLPVAFAAWDQPAEGAVAVGWDTCGGTGALVADPSGEVLFWALPPGEVGEGFVEIPGFPGVATVFAARNTIVVPRSLYPLPDRADAGADVCGVTGPVALDASGSWLADGITTWIWTWEGGSASGETVTADVPIGDTVVTLIIGGPGGEARDVVWVSRVASTDPPTDDEPLPATRDPAASGGGCGCDGSGSSSAGWLGLAAALGLAYRSGRSRIWHHGKRSDRNSPTPLPTGVYTPPMGSERTTRGSSCVTGQSRLC